MSGHYHDTSYKSANQGNTLGVRSCVRQSKLFRQYERSVKEIKKYCDADYIITSFTHFQKLYYYNH